MSKDRAAPFSRKHRRYWIPVTGGMVLIGVLNIAIGYCTYPDPPSEPNEQIRLRPPPKPPRDAGVIEDAPLDAAAPGPAGSATNR